MLRLFLRVRVTLVQRLLILGKRRWATGNAIVDGMGLDKGAIADTGRTLAGLSDCFQWRFGGKVPGFYQSLSQLTNYLRN